MEKWEGKVSTTLENTKAQEIWSLFKDFFNLHKYFSSLSISYGVHGTNGVPGCTRYCLGSSIKPSNHSDQNINGGDSISWSKERLVAVDEVTMSLSYEIVESNIGFNSYVSTVRISPIVGGDDDQGRNEGCVIEWGFTVDPVEGLRFEDLVKKYEVGLHKMVKAMQDSLKSLE